MNATEVDSNLIGERETLAAPVDLWTFTLAMIPGGTASGTAEPSTRVTFEDGTGKLRFGGMIGIDYLAAGPNPTAGIISATELAMTKSEGATFRLYAVKTDESVRPPDARLPTVDWQLLMTNSRSPGGGGGTLIDEKGLLVDNFDTTVPLSGGVQLNDLFRGRGLGDGPAAALIRITPFGGLVAAYATTTDNGTNDPVYFGASLVAK